MAGKLDAIDASPLAVAIRDATGCFLRVNESFAALLGVGSDDLTGSAISELLPADVAEGVERNDTMALHSPGVVVLEEWVVDRVGRRRIATARFALHDADGRPAGVCCVSSAAGHDRVVKTEGERLHALGMPLPEPAAAGPSPAEPPAPAAEPPPVAPPPPAAEPPAAPAPRAEAAELQRRLTAQAAAALAATRRADDRDAQAAAAAAARNAAIAEVEQLHERLSAQTAALAAAEQRLAAADGPPAAAPDHDLAALGDLVRVVTRADDHHAALQDAAACLGADLGWDAVFVWQQERGDRPLRCVAAWTSPHAELTRFATASWQGVFSPDAFADGARSRPAQAAGLQTRMVVTLDDDTVLEAFARDTVPVAQRELLATAAAIVGDLGRLLDRVSRPRWSVHRR